MSEAETIDMLSPEDRIAARYRELGIQIKNLQDERDAIKETELRPMLHEGIAFHYGSEILVPEYTARTESDWKRAKSDGVLTDAHLKEYLKTTVSEALYFRKSDDSEKNLYEAHLLRQKALNDQYKEELKAFREKKQNEVIK